MSVCIFVLMVALTWGVTALFHYSKVNSNLKWGPESRTVKILSVKEVTFNAFYGINGDAGGENERKVENDHSAHYFYRAKAMDIASGADLSWKLNCDQEVKSPMKMTYTPYTNAAAPRLEIRAVVGGPYRNEQEATASFGGAIPSDDELKTFTGVIGEGSDQQSIYVLQTQYIIGGQDFRSADPDVDANTGRRAVDFTLTSEAGDRFYNYTSKNVNHAMAVVMNDQIKEVANIEGPIRDSGRITGSFTLDEVTALSELLSGEPSGNYRTANFGILTNTDLPNAQIQCKVTADRGSGFFRRLFQ